MLLLSLLGEQPIPNLLPLWQYGLFTRTQFAATSATLPMALTLEQAIKQDPTLNHLTVLPPLKLDAYDIGKARVELAGALLAHQANNLPVCLNLTGGTKLMSLAAMQAGYGTGIALLYVATETNKMIWMRSDGSEERREDIQVKVNIAQYFSAHGLEIGADMSFIPGRVRHASPPPKAGDELEERAAKLAAESGFFDDVRRNVFVRKQTDREPVVNELDIVVTRNGRLAVCSCKTTQVETTNGKNSFKEAIYELGAISRREALGIYCGKVLISSQTDLPVALRDRARASGVRLVYGAEIAKTAEHILKATQ